MVGTAAAATTGKVVATSHRNCLNRPDLVPSSTDTSSWPLRGEPVKNIIVFRGSSSERPYKFKVVLFTFFSVCNFD